MRGLSKFFDTPAFLRGKRLEVTGVSKWLDYDTKATLGSKLAVIITEDNTVYPVKDGEVINNKYQPIAVKVRKTDLNVPVGAVVELISPTGTVYGQYHNQLSITADDVKVIGAAKG